MGDKPNIPQSIGPYTFVHNIGHGGFSTVYDANYLDSDKIVAIKVINKTQFPPDKFDRELSMLQSLDHPFVVAFYEFLQDDENYYLIMEKVDNGSLLSKMNRSGALPEWLSRHYFCEMISALDYLHNDLKIAHRDIKLENIMLDKNENIRLIDFGLGNIFRGENVVLQTACGSPAYAPPEMLTGKSYTTSADIWSAGVVLFAMTYGRLPFEDSNIQRLVAKIVLEEPRFEGKEITPDLLDLLKKLLTKDQNSRITIPEITEHPWFAKYVIAPQMNGHFGTKLVRFPFDSESLTTMQNMFNMKPDEVSHDLKVKKFNDVTALYKILRREKINEEMRNLQRNAELFFVNGSQTPLIANRATVPSTDMKRLIRQMKAKNAANTTGISGIGGGGGNATPLSMSLKLAKHSQNVKSQNPRQSQGLHAAAMSIVTRHNANVPSPISVSVPAGNGGGGGGGMIQSPASRRQRANSTMEQYGNYQKSELPML